MSRLNRHRSIRQATQELSAHRERLGLSFAEKLRLILKANAESQLQPHHIGIPVLNVGPDDLNVGTSTLAIKDPMLNVGVPGLHVEPVGRPEPAKVIAQIMDEAGAEEDPWKDLTNRQKALLLKFVKLSDLLLACIGICTPGAHGAWMKASAAYAKAFEDAKQMIKDNTLAHCFDLAIFGERIPLWCNGQPLLSRAGDQLYEIKSSRPLLLEFLRCQRLSFVATT